MTAKHPGKTASQRRVLDEMGCGDTCPPMTNKTREAMLASGLIVHLGDKVVGRDRFGEIIIPQFEMTLPVHIQWCKYWAEQPDD